MTKVFFELFKGQLIYIKGEKLLLQNINKVSWLQFGQIVAEFVSVPFHVTCDAKRDCTSLGSSSFKSIKWDALIMGRVCYARASSCDIPSVSVKGLGFAGAPVTSMG